MAIGSCASATGVSKRKNLCETGMWSLHRTLSLRYLRQRWLRAALIIVSIALGVAVLLATRVLNQSMAKAARGEGFEEIADWFETLAKAERSHANKFQKTLDAIVD